MKKVVNFISILFSIVFGLLSCLFILGLSFRVYNIDDYNKVILSIENDLELNLPKNLDYIYNANFVKYAILIFCCILVILLIINIKNKFYRGIKYVGSAMILSSTFIFMGIIFFNNLVSNFDESIGIILKNRIFLNSLLKNSTIFLIIGLFMIVLYAVVDTIYEKNQIHLDNVEIIEEG